MRKKARKRATPRTSPACRRSTLGHAARHPAEGVRVSRFGGYRMRDVDEFLDQITESMTALVEENERLRRRRAAGARRSARPTWRTCRARRTRSSSALATRRRRSCGGAEQAASTGRGAAGDRRRRAPRSAVPHRSGSSCRAWRPGAGPRRVGQGDGEGAAATKPGRRAAAPPRPRRRRPPPRAAAGGRGRRARRAGGDAADAAGPTRAHRARPVAEPDRRADPRGGAGDRVGARRRTGRRRGRARTATDAPGAVLGRGVSPTHPSGSGACSASAVRRWLTRSER